jgi:hypothetical protein
MGKELRLGGQGESVRGRKRKNFWEFTSRKGSWALLSARPSSGKA